MTKMLKRVLQDVLSEEENEQLISAFDQIGDIIIVRIPDSLVSKKQIIGNWLAWWTKVPRPCGSTLHPTGVLKLPYNAKNQKLI